MSCCACYYCTRTYLPCGEYYCTQSKVCSGGTCKVSSSTVAPSATVNQSIKGNCGGASCIMATLNTAMKTGSTIATSLIASCVQKKAIAAKVATAPASNMTMIIVAIIAVVGIIFLMKKA
jgi:hypothetical protein